MIGNIQLIDMLNQGVELKPEELMDVSNFLIESRRAYGPAINNSDSRAPFVDKNKIFEDKRKELLKQKAENAASEYVQNQQDQLYDLAVKKYRQQHQIKGSILPIDAENEIVNKYLPSIKNKAYSEIYQQVMKKPLTEDELRKIADYVKEYKVKTTKDIDKEIYNEFLTGDIPQSENFFVSPTLLKKHLFIQNNQKDEKGNDIFINNAAAYTGEDNENFNVLLKKVADKDLYFHEGQCYGDMKRFANDIINPIFNFEELYPNNRSNGAYRLGDIIFNRNDYDLTYDIGGFNAWDSFNNIKNNPYNFAFTEDNKITSNFGTSYPIGSVVYSGDATQKYLPGKPETDTNVYPRHITIIAGQSYNPYTDTVISLTSDFGKLRKLDKPVSNYKLQGVFTPNDVTVLSPRDEYKYVTFAKYYTPETIENLKRQLKQNNMSIDDFFLRQIQPIKPKLEIPLNIPLTLNPRKNKQNKQ